MKRTLVYSIIFVCTVTNAWASPDDFNDELDLTAQNEIVEVGTMSVFDYLARGYGADNSRAQCSGIGGFCGCHAYHTGSKCWETAVWCCSGLSCIGGATAYSGKCARN